MAIEELKVDLHVSYIQSLDKVKSLRLSLDLLRADPFAPPDTLAEPRRALVLLYGALENERSVLGIDGTRIDGQDGQVAQRRNDRMGHVLLG